MYLLCLFGLQCGSSPISLCWICLDNLSTVKSGMRKPLLLFDHCQFPFRSLWSLVLLGFCRDVTRCPTHIFREEVALWFSDSETPGHGRLFSSLWEIHEEHHGRKNEAKQKLAQIKRRERERDRWRPRKDSFKSIPLLPTSYSHAALPGFPETLESVSTADSLALLCEPVGYFILKP